MSSTTQTASRSPSRTIAVAGTETASVAVRTLRSATALMPGRGVGARLPSGMVPPARVSLAR